MKKNTKLVLSIIAALSIACVSVYAANAGKIGHKKSKRSQDDSQIKTERFRGFKDGKKAEISEEDKSAMLSACKERLENQLKEGKITDTEYNEAIAKIEAGEFPAPGMGRVRMKDKRPELSDEQKTDMLNKRKGLLNKLLENGKISRDEYDEAIAKIEACKFPSPGIGHMRMMGKRPELSDEQKAKMPKKGKGMMNRRNPDGHIIGRGSNK